jgi:CubicO group peptidase (beta-lactamase class C family)
MESLQSLLDRQYADERFPGAVALVGRADGVDVGCAGVRTLGGTPMTRDTLFRVASLTKPILAAVAMVLVERGRLRLDDAVDRWLPELGDPVVMRDLAGETDDVVPAERAITVRDLLTFQSGHGFPPAFDLPVVRLLMSELSQGPVQPQSVVPPDEWMARLARIPLLHQPGKGWTYNTGADILGVLLARLEAAPLPDVFADTVLGPLGMSDTGFMVRPDDVARLTSSYRRDESGQFTLIDPPDGEWTRLPAFAAGAGGLVSSADDLLTFQRMLLNHGEHNGTRVLSADSVRQMTTSHVEADRDNPFLQGQGWGFGGSVDLQRIDPWNVPGRYGWVGGSGTAAYIYPDSGAASIWLTQVELQGPDDFSGMAEFLTYAAEAVDGV